MSDESAPLRYGIVGGGFVGTALTYLLAQDGFFAKALANTPARPSLSTARPAHFAPKAKNCIFLFMYGGPSHVDLFDPKPELTKRDGQPMPNLEKDPRFDAGRTAGKPLLGSLWEFRKRGESGIEVSTLFPKLAERVDRLAVIRSCHADSFAHGSGLLQMNTGSLRQGYPSLGAWVTYGLGTVNQNLPAFVVLPEGAFPQGGAANWSNGFLPAAFQPTRLRDIARSLTRGACAAVRLGVRRPSGPSFTLNNAVDELFKREFDIHRANGTTHPLAERYGVDAVPLNDPRLEEWRDAFYALATQADSGAIARSTFACSSRTASASNEIGHSSATSEISWKMWFGTMSRRAPAVS